MMTAEEFIDMDRRRSIFMGWIPRFPNVVLGSVIILADAGRTA